MNMHMYLYASIIPCPPKNQNLINGCIDLARIMHSFRPPMVVIVIEVHSSSSAPSHLNESLLHSGLPLHPKLRLHLVVERRYIIPLRISKHILPLNRTIFISQNIQMEITRAT